MRNPQRQSCTVRQAVPTSHNIHKWPVRDAVRRSVSPPTPAEWGMGPNITSIPKPWQAPVHRSLDVNAPEALALERRRLLAGQHRVVAVPIVHEHRVIVAQPHSAGVYAA